MPTRSAFLAGAGAFVLIATQSGCANPHAAGTLAPPEALSPGPWIRITPSDRLEVLVGKSEMGQGIATGFATVLAEESGARLDQIDIVFPVADEAFDDPVLHTMLTGGSLSIPNVYPSLRRAGASARAMLIAAAAAKWNVSPDACAARDGVVTGPNGMRASFGSLASDAARLAVPTEVVYRDPHEYSFVGKHVPRVDIPSKVDGSSKFGIDTVLPGMAYATVVHPPIFGATFASMDDAAARKLRGVLDVFPIASGVAVVATSTWSAFQGARALKIVWHEPDRKVDSAGLFAEAASLASDPSRRKTARAVGDVEFVGARTLTATYTGPFLAHAALEPINATAVVSGGKCVVYAPTQVQTASRALAAKAAGVSFDDVELHTTLIGGGFGRRLHGDYVAEAVEIAKHHGTPVKMTWMREEDTQHDYYRPMFHSDIRAELDAAGSIAALAQTIVSPSTLRISIPEYSGGKVDGELLAGVGASWNYVSNLYLHGFDQESVQGAFDTPYVFPNLSIGYVEHTTPVPVGDMRAPEANWNSFVLETFIDECAYAAGRRPEDVRRELLAHSPRALAVLERVIARSGYGSAPAPRGEADGLALISWLGSLAATVARVAIVDGRPAVRQLWVVADIGRVINPDNVRAQLEGGSLFGLSMAMTGRITLANGRVEQSNFHDYQVLRMSDAPRVTAEYIDSDALPTGVGEVGVPGVAPAVANALFTLTGRRARSMPFAS
jgi:isoquinoline 1-oxidoreductase beta subunit